MGQCRAVLRYAKGFRLGRYFTVHSGEHLVVMMSWPGACCRRKKKRCRIRGVYFAERGTVYGTRIQSHSGIISLQGAICTDDGARSGASKPSRRLPARHRYPVILAVTGAAAGTVGLLAPAVGGNAQAFFLHACLTRLGKARLGHCGRGIAAGEIKVIVQPVYPSFCILGRKAELQNMCRERRENKVMPGSIVVCKTPALGER